MNIVLGPHNRPEKPTGLAREVETWLLHRNKHIYDKYQQQGVSDHLD